MQCNQCGQTMDDGSLFCNHCGAPVQSAEDDYSEPIQMDEPSPMDEAPVAPVKNKSKKNILIGVAAGVLLVAIVLVLCFSPLKYWIVRTFTDPADLLVNAYTDGIHSLFTLSEYAEEITGAASKEAQSTKTEMHIKLADEVLNSMSESVFGYSQDMTWMSDIALTVQTSAKDNLMKTDLNLGLAEHSLLTAEAILDSQSKTLWLTVPELQSQSLTTALDDMDMDAFAPAMASGVQVSDDVAEKLLVRYMELFLKGFSQVEKSKQDVTAGSITQSVTVLKASMSEKDFFNTLTSVFNQMKEDQELKQILTDTGIYEDFISSLDGYLEDFPELIEESDPDKLLNLYTYLNKTNDFIGFEYSVPDSDEKLCAIVLSDKKQFAADITFITLKIQGNGSMGTSTESVWQIKESGTVVMDMEVAAAADKSGNVSGEIHLKPSSGLMEEMFGTASNAEVDIALSGNTQQADVEVTVKNDGQALFSIESTAVVTEAEEIIIPENAADMADEEAMNAWAMGIDPTQLITALSEAGFPIELLLASMMGL